MNLLATLLKRIKKTESEQKIEKLTVCKGLDKWLLFWVYKVVTTDTHQSKTLLFSKGKLAFTNKCLQKFDALHFTIRAGEGDFVPNFFKRELRLRPYAIGIHTIANKVTQKLKSLKKLRWTTKIKTTNSNLGS